MKDFAGFGHGATYLWPRWLVLRGVGLVYVVIFAGIIADTGALIGPQGLTPLPEVMAQQRAAYPELIVAVMQAPTLFWLNTQPFMPVILGWVGLLAAAALVLNLWPRLALLGCWVALLSFARGWLVYSDPQVDWLMLEVALLCLPFAPAGRRPGLGAASPPQPLALFMMRWLLFRVMFETGLAKLLGGDPHWRNFTAMDVLYETAPSPTVLGYFAHHLPHAWHLTETGLTFAAEIASPLLALLAGRRGRWAAFACWSAFQIGIQLTCNFGWLNTASFALGFILLDDQMIASAWAGLRRKRRDVVQPAPEPVLCGQGWRWGVVSAALWTHFALSILVFWGAMARPLSARVETWTAPLRFLFAGFGSVNAYTLYGRLDPFHFVVEFVGSNDGGVTWRPYEFRYFPQALDRMSPFVAPRFPRFEATLQIQAAVQDKPTALYRTTATRLLEQKPAVLRLFRRDPFPDRPPTMIRTPGYRYTFTDRATQRSTGEFWRREYLGEYLPMIYRDEAGRIVESQSALAQLKIAAHYGNAVAQARLGYLFASGDEGVEKSGSEAAKWFRRAAEQGLADAQFNLALSLLAGDGVAKNEGEALRWCRLAAEQGLIEAQDRLGVWYFSGVGGPKNESEGLAWFQVAALAGYPEAAKHRALAASRMDAAVARAALERGKTLAAEIARRSAKK